MAAGLLFCGVSFFVWIKTGNGKKIKKMQQFISNVASLLILHISVVFSITLERIEKIFFLMCRLKCF